MDQPADVAAVAATAAPHPHCLDPARPLHTLVTLGSLLGSLSLVLVLGSLLGSLSLGLGSLSLMH